MLRGEKSGRSQSFAQLPPALRSYARAKDLLILTKSNSRSTVHRPGYMDYIGIKRYDAAGEVCGEHRFLGLYASTAYSANPADIPLLRTKVADVIARTGVVSVSHDAKALTNILDTYPRDELFQVSVERLSEIVQAILRLHGRQRLRMFDRRDPYGRFVTCLIYAPREHYTTALRRRWQSILVAAFNGTGSDFSVLLSEATLARVLITVRTVPGSLPAVDVTAIEADLARAARRWEDDLRDALEETLGEARGSGLAHRYASAFPAAYREDFDARSAVPDVELVERALAGDAPAISLYRPLEAAAGTLRFKLAHRGGPVPLSDALPMLERMGLRVIEERPYRVAPDGGERVWLHDYGMTGPMSAAADIDSVRAVFEDAFARVYAGEVDSDDFNRLVLTARLAADEVVVLRAYARYLRQTGFTLSQAFIEATLGNQPAIARMLVSLFRLRFDPAAHDDEAAARQVRAIEMALEHVTNLSEDRVLRQLLALILATLRTNFWRRDAARPAAGLSVVQVRSRQGAGAAGAEAEVRDLRLLAALRGRAPARRQGRARRPALVGPPGGLPHRGAGPDEGADGEEHRDRAGRLEGRLRAQARAESGRPRRVPEGGRRLLPGLPARPARRHRQSRRRRRRAAAATSTARTATIPTSSSPPTRAPRRSPTTPTRSRRSTASGSTTPSPPAARSATTTRRWASPRAAPGSR